MTRLPGKGDKTRARDIFWYDLVHLPRHLDKGSDGERLLLKAIKHFGQGLPMPRTQVKVGAAIGRKFKTDAAYEEAGLLIEVDGGQWLKTEDADGNQIVGGAHNRDTDRWRNALLTAHGYRILHFSPEMIREEPERVVKVIQTALAASITTGGF